MISAAVLLALLAGGPASARLALVESEQAGREHALAAAAVDACVRSFPAGRPVALFDVAAVGGGTTLARMHAAQRWPVLLTLAAAAGNQTLGHRVYALVLVALSAQLPRLRDELRAQPAWSARARIVVALRDADGAAARAQHAMETLWAVGAAHVLVLGRRAAGVVDAHIWRPYEAGGQCAERVRRVVLVDTWTAGGAGGSGGLFAGRALRDLHDCPVSVATFEWPPFIVNLSPSPPPHANPRYDGLEIRLLHAVAAATRFRPVYLPPSPDKWGWEMANGSWAGAYGQLHSRRAQVMIASLIKSTTKMAEFDNTHFYVTNAVVWIAPRARAIPHWQSLAKIFTASFWALLVATITLAAAIFWAMASLPRAFRVRSGDPQGYNSVASCVSNALAVLLGVSVFRQPRTAALRCFFLLYAMYCLQINTAYQSSLITSLTNPRAEKQIATDQDLHDSSLSLFYSFGYDAYLNPDDALQASLLRRVGVCPNDTACLSRCAHDGDVAMLADRAFVEFLTPALFTDRRGQPLVKAFPLNLISYHVGMMLNKDSLLLDRFDQVIDRIREAGLMSKWRTEVARLSKVKYASASASATAAGETDGDAGGARPLTTAHLQGAYVLLAGGLVTSAAVFVAEVATARWKRRSRLGRLRVGR